MTPSPLLASVFLPVLAAGILAQDHKATDAKSVEPKAEANAAKADLSGKKALVEQALATTSAAHSLSFESKYRVDSQFTRMVQRGGKPTPVTVTGSLADGVLRAKFNDGDDEALFSGRRTAVRAKGEAWTLRDGKLADGRPMPHVFDPDKFFAALGEAKLEVLNAAVGSLDDKPVEVVTVKLDEESSRSLSWSGALPSSSEMGGMATVVFAGGAAGAPAAPKADVEIDAAFYIDPATKRILQLKVKSYSKQSLAGGVVRFAVAGGVVEEEEDEEEDTTKKSEAVTFKDGLPVRKKAKKDNWTIASYDVVLKEHDAVKAQELDAKAKQLLGIKGDK